MNLLVLLLAGLVSAAELTLKAPKLTVEYADKREPLQEKLVPGCTDGTSHDAYIITDCRWTSLSLNQ